jgi:hypothetical protein
MESNRAYAEGSHAEAGDPPAGAAVVIEAGQSGGLGTESNGTVDGAAEAAFQSSSARRYRLVTEPGGLSKGNADSIRILSSLSGLRWMRSLIQYGL